MAFQLIHSSSQDTQWLTGHTQDSMHFIINYIISYNCTISASPLGLQLHPNQLWHKREDVWEQQHKELHWMMSPGTAIQECLSITPVRLLLRCITSNSSLYSYIVSEIARRECISQTSVFGYRQFCKADNIQKLNCVHMAYLLWLYM